MRIIINQDKKEAGNLAAEIAAEILQEKLKLKGNACFIAATGASQFEFLAALCKKGEIGWENTEMFHLDEYIGISASHPASFRKYLSDRLVEIVHPGKVHFIEGDTADPALECQRISDLIARKTIDIAFIGIGENGHIAFNDPPADFETEAPYIIVNLDLNCRQQQVNEGWFASLDEVPQQAISMSVRQIMTAEIIICVCPDKRKAAAVHDCLSIDAPISPLHPASILKLHENAFIFLDKGSASLLNQNSS